MNIKRIEYPHYENLPRFLKDALNLLRTAVHSDIYHECCPEFFIVDENDLTFLNLDSLIFWVKKELPSFDLDFLSAAARIHKECYEEELFDHFAVEEGDLFEEVLFLKDCYELKLTEGE